MCHSHCNSVFLALAVLEVRQCVSRTVTVRFLHCGLRSFGLTVRHSHCYSAFLALLRSSGAVPLRQCVIRTVTEFLTLFRLAVL